MWDITFVGDHLVPFGSVGPALLLRVGREMIASDMKESPSGLLKCIVHVGFQLLEHEL